MDNLWLIILNNALASLATVVKLAHIIQEIQGNQVAHSSYDSLLAASHLS